MLGEFEGYIHFEIYTPPFREKKRRTFLKAELQTPIFLKISYPLDLYNFPRQEFSFPSPTGEFFKQGRGVWDPPPLTTLRPNSNMVRAKSHPNPTLSGQLMVISVGSPGLAPRLICTVSVEYGTATRRNERRRNFS